MLPAELRRLVLAWSELDDRITPGRSSKIGLRHGASSDPVLGEVTDARRQALRRFRNTKRVAIDRLAVEIQTWVREVKRCKCGREISWDDAWCGETGEGGCGRVPDVPSRTKAAD